MTTKELNVAMFKTTTNVDYIGTIVKETKDAYTLTNVYAVVVLSSSQELDRVKTTFQRPIDLVLHTADRNAIIDLYKNALLFKYEPNEEIMNNYMFMLSGATVIKTRPGNLR
jgi:hypothetical protein